MQYAKEGKPIAVTAEKTKGADGNICPATKLRTKASAQGNRVEYIA
ncbi:MAG: hypothetical protein RR846_03175 [Oscillospiraceae bacterium]